MHHGYEFDVNVTGTDIWQEVTLVEPGGVRTQILRQVINTMDTQTRSCLMELGWSPPPAPSLSKKCLVKGCENHSSQGKFIGDLCMPCHEMITSGRVTSTGITFIHSIRERLRTISTLAF
jgi:hypothetical protein